MTLKQPNNPQVLLDALSWAPKGGQVGRLKLTLSISKSLQEVIRFHFLAIFIHCMPEWKQKNDMKQNSRLLSV